MPVLIAAVVLAFVAGLAIRPPAFAYAVSGALGVACNVAFVWAIADGKGDDPAWIIVLSLAAAAVALGATWVGLRLRSGRSFA
jgi:peptidoglycan biosynthesis protein MviN/MurJ (putative lipid II flippase)